LRPASVRQILQELMRTEELLSN